MAGDSFLVGKIEGATKLDDSFSLVTLEFKYVYRSSFVQGLWNQPYYFLTSMLQW